MLLCFLPGLCCLLPGCTSAYSSKHLPPLLFVMAHVVSDPGGIPIRSSSVRVSHVINQGCCSVTICTATAFPDVMSWTLEASKSNVTLQPDEQSSIMAPDGSAIVFLVQVWVITGDKQETAINIAISCKLINHPDTLHICNASSPESAHSRLRELLQQVRQQQNPAIRMAERAAAPTTAELVASAIPLPEGPSENFSLLPQPCSQKSSVQSPSEQGQQMENRPSVFLPQLHYFWMRLLDALGGQNLQINLPFMPSYAV